MFAIEVQPWWKDPNWLTAIGTIAATVIAALAIAYSIFKESIWSWWNRPKLVLSTTPGRPDWVKIFFTLPTGKRIADCYYFRIRVANKGRKRAESVELFAKELKEKRAGKFHVVHTFPNMDLLWSNVQVPELAISPKVEKHCDVGFVLDPKNDGRNVRTRLNLSPDRCLFTFELQAKPNDEAQIVGPGHYRLTVVAASANTSSVVRELELTITGDWFDNEAEMFRADTSFGLGGCGSVWRIPPLSCKIKASITGSDTFWRAVPWHKYVISAARDRSSATTSATPTT